MFSCQRVLSVQVTQAEQNQRHNLFHTKGVVKERHVCVIIDGGSCNNLASMVMVIEAGVSRSFDEMITIDLVKMTLTIRLQTCTTLRLSNR